jgi:RHS repeat-associated protein
LAKLESGVTHGYLYEANGNVGQMVNAATGSVDARYEYDPYGNALLSTGAQAAGNPFRFSTKYLDRESGLYYYGYRFYDPETGRWTNRDPLGEAEGMNLYHFVLNNPANYLDGKGDDVLEYVIGGAVLSGTVVELLKRIFGSLAIYYATRNISKDITWDVSLPKTRTREFDHRGRIQAQGNGVNKSSPWAQSHPLTLMEGRILLGLLVAQLTHQEAWQRKSAIIATSEWMTKVANENKPSGIAARHTENFLEARYTRQRSSIDSLCDTRIDIEVLAGRAFVLK